ncbi:MAG: hypothetical protein KAT04_14490 [Methylococcales bacterium]|nr:hypothetical protein [Methylococcales bacterium]
MNRNIGKIKAAFELFKESSDKMNEANKILSGGQASYYYEKVEGYIDALFKKYAPFQKGDRIKIVKKPRIGNGWIGSRHFLIKGSEGIIQDVDFYNNHFCADVIFDNETWIDSNGDERPVSVKSTYRMWEKQIKKVK